MRTLADRRRYARLPSPGRRLTDRRALRARINGITFRLLLSLRATEWELANSGAGELALTTARGRERARILIARAARVALLSIPRY